MQRLANFIAQSGSAINDITVTMDSHPYVAIERATFWMDAEGKEVAPFTEITADDVLGGRYRVRNGDRIEPVSQKMLTARVIDLLVQLEAAGRYKLMVWPVHCVTGTWGANIHHDVADALAKWELDSRWPVRKVQKGEYELAEPPIYEVPSTRFNADLAMKMSHGVDVLFVGGQASSHCVAASVDQLVKFQRGAHNIVLLTDCMSPVPGFEAQADAFFQRSAAAGAKLMTTQQALSLLNN
jgi:nicotinamidase-related amidase